MRLPYRLLRFLETRPGAVLAAEKAFGAAALLALAAFGLHRWLAPAGEPDGPAAGFMVRDAVASEDDRRAAIKHWQSGIIYFQKGDAAKAAEEWRKCKELDPGNADCENGLNRIGPAAAASRPAPAAGGDRRAAAKHWKAGDFHFKRKRWDKARQEWTRCRDLDPSNAACARGLAKLGGRQSGSSAPPAPAAAQDDRRAAVRHWQAGIMHFQKGDYAKARDEWLLCRSLDQANADCNNGLQRIENTHGGGP